MKFLIQTYSFKLFHVMQTFWTISVLNDRHLNVFMSHVTCVVYICDEYFCACDTLF